MGLERDSKKGGGVGFLLAKELNYKIKTDYCQINECLESFFVEITTKGGIIVCGSIYHPPNTNVKTFQKELNKIMEKIKLEKHKECIIGMDHNLDFIKHNQHTDTENFINKMVDSSLFLCITWPTRVMKNTSTLIDNIFVSGKLHDKIKSCVILHDISDHFPSFVIVENLLAKKREPKVILSRDITDDKIADLNYELSSISWEKGIPKVNATEAYDVFIDLLQSHLNSKIPLKEKTISAKRYLCEPWLTKGIVRCGKKQLKLYKHAIKSGNEEDLRKYKAYKSVLQKTKHNCKKEYYNIKCTQFKSDTKRLWKIINNATKGQNDKSCVIDALLLKTLK